MFMRVFERQFICPKLNGKNPEIERSNKTDINVIYYCS